MYHNDANLFGQLADEFNKYLSYVRNLGFEDTPDYDYLRDLFTQSLKNAGEVEDGEYDWMKLNNGRGYEQKSSFSSQQQLNSPLADPGRDMRGSPLRVPRAGVTADRLNAAQPPPPSPAKPGPGRARERPSGSGGMAAKRVSGALDGAVTSSSQQAQYGNSNANRHSRIGSPMVNGPQNPGVQASNESQHNFFQKAMRALCCGKFLNPLILKGSRHLLIPNYTG